jgi:hypothetical protein
MCRKYWKYHRIEHSQVKLNTIQRELTEQMWWMVSATYYAGQKWPPGKPRDWFMVVLTMWGVGHGSEAADSWTEWVTLFNDESKK